MLLEVKNMNTFYGPSHVLQDLSLTVERGEIVALLGRNGMGKSTTLMSIMGLVRPRSGQVIYNGRDLAGKPPYRIAKAGIGYIPEDRRIFANLTVLENLNMGAKNQGKNGGGSAANRWTLERIFATFPWMKERSAQHGQFLSGGEQQMLAMGRALMGNPELLLVDEPTSSLDVSIQSSIINLLLDLQDDLNTSFMYISHNLAVVSYISDYMAVMYLGRLVEVGPTGDILNPPYHPYTEALLSSVSMPNPDVEQKRIRLSGAVPSARDVPSGCRFHTRCPRKVGEECEREPIPDRRTGNHVIRCVIPEEELEKTEPVLS